MAGVVEANGEQQPQVFKLDVDCWDEILDWLSIVDVLSFGRTCKGFHRVAGDYLKWKYIADFAYQDKKGFKIIANQRREVSEDEESEDGDSVDEEYKFERSKFEKIAVEVNDFLQYVQRILIVSPTLNKDLVSGCVTVKDMVLNHFVLTESFIKTIEPILSQTEGITLYNCNIAGRAYNDFFKTCVKLKRLDIDGHLT